MLIKEMTLNDSIKATFNDDTVVLTDTASRNTITLTKQSVWTMYHHLNGTEKHRDAVLKIISECEKRYPEAKNMFTDEKIAAYIADASAYYDEVIGYSVVEDEIFDNAKDYTDRKLLQ